MRRGWWKKWINKLLRIWYTFTQLWVYYNCNKDVRKQTIRNDRDEKEGEKEEEEEL